VTACKECGVGNSGAYLIEEGDRTLCTDCAGPGECERCGAETEETTLSGEWRCESCQQTRRDEDTTREAGQPGLGRWSA
jgi:hypothetical protein